MISMTHSLMAAVCLACLVDASSFLGVENQASMEYVSVEHVEQSLLAELAGRSNDRRPLSQIEAALRTMYAALPKGTHGNLDSVTVRYALHRYFVQQHGWYMKGLEPAGHAWSNFSSETITKDKVPAYIQSLFDRRVNKAGLGLRELSVFAATLEDLVQWEAVDSLRTVYHVLQLPTIVSISPKKVGKAVSTHLMMYLVGNISATSVQGLVIGNVTATSMEDLSALEEEAIYMYPPWPDLQMWVEDLRKSTVYGERHRRNPFKVSGGDFSDAIQAVAEVTERFGVYQDAECKALKNSFLKMEILGTGRMRLSDFWGRGLAGEWQFTESMDYLRELGALDESNPQVPTVIIPNYLYSPSNCVSERGFYAVCCRNACEGLLGHLERELVVPTAVPRRIAEVTTTLLSKTVDTPRNLSSALLGRLADIAAHHGGNVPLHGRLFAQWMHHVFPRECPFPHAAGTTSPQSAEEWVLRTGQDPFALDEEMVLIVDRAKRTTIGEEEMIDLPWETIEELVALDGSSFTTSLVPSARGVFRGGALVGALASLTVVALRTLRTGASASDMKGDSILV